MPQHPGSSFADDLAAVRGSSQGPRAGGGDDFLADLESVRTAAPTDTRSTFARVVDVATTPLVTNERARAVSGRIMGQSAPAGEMRGGLLDVLKAIPDVLRNVVKEPAATVRGAVGGAVEGLATFTDPLNLGLMATGGIGRAARVALTPALAAVREAEQAITAARASGRFAEIPELVKQLTTARQVAGRAQAAAGAARGLELGSGAAIAARGGERIADADSDQDRAVGVAQAAMGLLGVKLASPPVGRLRAAPPVARLALPEPAIRITPDGVAVPPGVSIPERPPVLAPEGPSVRPAAIVGRGPNGPIYSSDPNAASVRLEPRALLPERAAAAAEWIPGPDGSLVRRGDLPAALAALGERPSVAAASSPAPAPQGKARGKAARESSVVPAPVMDFTPYGERVFSGDPVAASVKVPPLTNLEVGEVRRIAAELDSMPFTSHTFNEIPVGRGGSLDVVPGGAGAPVYHDIVSLHGRGNPSRADVLAAIEKYLAGEPTVYAPAIREVARLRLKGHLRGQLPPDAGDLPQSGAMNDQDFDEFSRMVDRLAAEGPDESGAINAALLSRMGGAAAGATVGGTVGETREDRIRGALAGAAVGALVPSLAGTGRPLARLRLASPDIPAGSLDARVSGLAPARPVESPVLDASSRFLAESGAVTPQLAARIGGGVAGATYGAATGEDTGDRAGRAAVFGVLGAVAPSVLTRGGAPVKIVKGRIVSRGVAEDGAARVAREVDSVSAFPTTGRAPGRPDTAMADPLKGIDPFVERFPEEVRAGIRQVLEDNGGFAAQRRGVLDHEDTAKLAEGVAVDLSRRLKPGQALNAEGVRAYSNALATVQDRVQQLSAKVTSGQATDADVVALETARAELKTVAASIMGARSEIGRALGEFNVLHRVLRSGNPHLIRDAATQLRGEAAQFADAFAQQPNDPLSRYSWLKTQLKPTGQERFRQYYYANILSGFKTHARNTVGNAANAITNVVAQPFAAGADLARSLATGKPREVFFSELPSNVAGALSGIPEGVREALYSLRNGVNRSALTQALSAAEAGKLDVPRVEFGGGGANPFNWPGRALDSADQFFRAIARNQELFSLAHAQARKEGLTGAKLQDRMASLISGVDEVSIGLQQRADAFARRAVFQEKPGRFAASVQAFSKQHPWFSFIVPFVKTPANILRQGLEASPAGFGMKAARAGGREGAEALGRAALGTSALTYLAYLAATGRLSGSGPSDPAARAQLMESGWRPNSVKVGDQWVSYTLFQPVSVPASVVANAFEQWRDDGANPDALSRVGGTVLKSVRSFLDQSFLSGLAEMVDAVEGFNLKSAARVVGRAAHSVTPFAGAQRTIRDAVDPNVRQPEGVAENIAAAVPGLSATVPARLDRFGREIVKEGGAIRRATDPLNITSETRDPVVLELGRVGVKMGMPGGTLNLPGDAELSRDQSRALQITKGTATYRVLEAIINSEVYQGLPDDRKADALERAIQRTRSKAGAAFKRQTIKGLLQPR